MEQGCPGYQSIDLITCNSPGLYLVGCGIVRGRSSCGTVDVPQVQNSPAARLTFCFEGLPLSF